MRALRHVLLITAMIAIPSANQARANESFAEIVGRVLSPSSDGTVSIHIDSLYRIGSDGTRESTEILQVSCPSEGIANWRTFFHTGDSLTLDWHEVRDPSRGWLFLGGRGGQAALKFPQSGIVTSCSCRGKSDELFATLSGEFITDVGSVREIPCRGRSEFLLKRLLPLWRGHTARPPQHVRLRLGWHSPPDSRLIKLTNTR